MLENISSELQKSPLATIAAVVGALVSTLSLALAWLQLKGPTSKLNTAIPIETKDYVNIANALLIIAFFVAGTTACAFVTRLILNTSKSAAFFASIILAIMIGFLTVTIIYMAPPKILSQELFTSAQSLLVYASMLVYLAFCIGGIFKNLSDEDIVAAPFVLLFVLIFWYLLVWKGQLVLAKVFLPEITYLVVQAQ
jgi:magnesium-transporting ATPase (P-type)